jgi:ATP-binding cassette subfamily B multidrug efflux pump
MRRGYSDVTTKKERLFDPRVTKFLLGYVLRYKGHLVTSMLLVLIITTITMATPWVARTIIDRYIIKRGYQVNLAGMEDTHPALQFLRENLDRGIRLSETNIFFLEKDMRFFSSTDLEFLQQRGIFSTETGFLLEKPDLSDRSLQSRFNSLVNDGEITAWNDDLYTMSETIMSDFPGTDKAKLRHHDIFMISVISLAMIAVLLLQFVATFIQVLSLIKMSAYAMRDLRTDIFTKLITYEVSYFEKNPIGKLVNRITNDVEVLADMFSSVIITLFGDILLLAGITIVLVRESPMLSLILLVTIPLIIFITALFRVKSKKAYRRVRDKVTSLNSFLQETVSGIKIVKLFSARPKITNKFNRANNQLYRAYMSQIFIYAVFRPLLGILRWITVACIIYFGSRGILAQTISFGLLVLFLQYIQNFFRPIWDMAEKFDMIISANAAGEKILGVLEDKARRESDTLEPLDDDAPVDDDGHPGKASGSIEFKNVSFSYTRDNPVLHDINFKVNPGQSLAIVGETGSGKTTIISLLNRFYEIKNGSLLLGGKDIKTMPYSRVRKGMAVVMQDVFLFARSIRDNIILNNTFDQEWYDHVLDITHVRQLLGRLPDGDMTVAAERGATFSAGERQLLSFARALYVKPRVLVLDEATSNIDSETEKLIQDATTNMVKDRTAIIIAHRLSTIKNADSIIVLDKGKIREQGSHEELIAHKGLYYNLYSLQFAT